MIEESIPWKLGSARRVPSYLELPDPTHKVLKFLGGESKKKTALEHQAPSYEDPIHRLDEAEMSLKERMQFGLPKGVEL